VRRPRALKLSRPRWSRAAPPSTLAPQFFRRFGRRVDPEVARQVADEVQRDAIDRLRGDTVETVIWRLVDRLNMCRARVYLHLRAGRYLKSMETR
jgi:hypothetical protein